MVTARGCIHGRQQSPPPRLDAAPSGAHDTRRVVGRGAMTSVSERRMSISIVIASYRRPEPLDRCLRAVAAQEALPDETVVVVRKDDRDTRTVLGRFDDLPVGEVVVDKPGVLAAMTAGVQATKSEMVALLDDDTRAAPDWLERVQQHLQRPGVGGVCGRDIVSDEPSGPVTSDVGRVTKWGKVIGNHHLGCGAARPVEVLKGANMAFRREALALPQALRGSGAQVHWELATCLWACAQGWKLVFDPSLTVQHSAAPRIGSDRRRPEGPAVTDAAENLVLSLVSFRPELLWRRAAYGLLVGGRDAPGLARAAAALLQGERDVLRRLAPSLRGQADAVAALLRGYRLPMNHFGSLESG
jgi:glycosyltransferase involved in cell wall biosynthesis